MELEFLARVQASSCDIAPDFITPRCIRTSKNLLLLILIEKINI